MHVGRSIKVAIAKSGRNQKWLADELGVTSQRVSMLSNAQSANTTTLEDVAECFGLKVSELVELSE